MIKIKLYPIAIFLLTIQTMPIITQTDKSTASAASSSVEEYTVLERWSKASPDKNWIVEFKNKTNKPVYVQLYKISPDFVKGARKIIPAIPVSDAYNPYGSLKNDFSAPWRQRPNPNTRIGAAKGPKEADAGYLRIAPIDKYGIELQPGSTDWFLFIWDEQRAKLNSSAINTSTGASLVLWLKPNYERKIITFTLEPEGSNNIIRPQSGKFFSHKSQSGLSLSGNIKESDIVALYDSNNVELLNFANMSITDANLNKIRETKAQRTGSAIYGRAS